MPRKSAAVADKSSPQSVVVRSSIPTGNPGGRPAGADIVRFSDGQFYGFLKRAGELSALGAPLYLVAKASGGKTYATLYNWRTAGQKALEALEPVSYEELRHATVVMLKPSDKGGSLVPIMTHTAERLAKFAMVLDEGDAMYIANALAAGNVAAMNGDGRLAIAMLHRKHPQYRDRPVKAVAPAAATEDARNPSGSANGGVLLKRITTKIPANGFRPGEKLDDDEAVQRVGRKGLLRKGIQPSDTRPAVRDAGRPSVLAQADKPMARPRRGGYVRVPRG